MNKISIFVALIIAAIVGVSTIFLKDSGLKSQKQGWEKQFSILSNRVGTQEQRLNTITAHIDYQYAPVVNVKFNFRRFGIGGQVDQTAGFAGDKYRSLTKRIKIDLARVNVLEYKAFVINELARKMKDSLRHTPNIRPVPLDSIHTISSFGLRIHPILHVLKMHEGIDYGCYVGTPVRATADGIVVFSGYDPISGKYIKIEHGYGYTTVYAHLSKRLVVKGQKVVRGQIIGYSGNTGRSEGPHLHYEVRVYGQHVNPVRFVANPIPAEKQSLYSRRSHSYLIAR